MSPACAFRGDDAKMEAQLWRSPRRADLVMQLRNLDDPIGWPSIFFAIIERVANGYGLLRGACHRARIRATRWLAMTKLHLRCGKATRRANHPKVCPALRAKTFRLTCRANQRH